MSVDLIRKNANVNMDQGEGEWGGGVVKNGRFINNNDICFNSVLE